MAKWHPRDELSCQAELDRLDADYERVKGQFTAACKSNAARAYELSAELQALSRRMFQLEKREFDRLVVRVGEAALG